eukprot:CAMPEP_0116870772 /NCGR_PEP_ID=MMETSP0463-20121206/842_1 /TAXON_ID=181622 /ORGANISM="Strombidinopsis sp, Strain SopsisLIS2011" /LENGTH=68 /DNA_ID=CAMNT_0004507967 /DNA_START=1281 /DNA_END=1487 /DNA_ORIENTATION=+
MNCLPGTLKFVLGRILVAYSVLGFASLFPNVNVMLSLFGAVCGTIIQMILPVIFYEAAYKIDEKKDDS